MDGKQVAKHAPEHHESGDQLAPASPWQYGHDDASMPQPAQAAAVSWTASEFIDHEKNAAWFINLAGVTILAAGLLYLIFHDLVTTFVIIVAAALFAVGANRKPRTLQYQLDHNGVSIGEKGYAYALFKSFSVLEEGAFSSIQLMPLKRFMPPISLYYPPEHENEIVDTLGSYLPHEVREHDAVERLMRKIRF